jgi:hypothetical protein
MEEETESPQTLKLESAEQKSDVTAPPTMEVPAAPQAPPRKPYIPDQAVVAYPVVRFSASRIEPDLDGVFLANKASTTIGSAAARSDTDLHVTGCQRAVGLLLTSSPSPVEIKIDSESAGCFEKSNGSTGSTLYLSNRMRVNITTSRVAVGIDGTVVNTMSGQASTAIDSIINVQMQRCSTVVPIVYASWLDFGAVVEISNVTFIDDETGKEYDKIVFYDTADHNATCKRAADALEGLYNQSVAVRQAVVFKPAPPLSKSVMRVPFGIDGSTYDMCSSVVSRPISLERESFESLMTSAMRLETNWNGDAFERFMQECRSPGIAASRWSGAVANALSTFVSSICPYRIDGRTVITPTGMQMTAAESWKAEASRTACNTSDDCDGSGAHVTSGVMDARRVALDPTLAETFPVTARVANALSMHFVGICVLAANAGNASDAGKQGVSAVAGHAIAMAIPRSMAFDAMVTGAMSATQSRNPQDSDALVEKLRTKWFAAMFSQAELEAMSEEDRALLKDIDFYSSLHKNAAVGEMEALAIEGTSPVSPSLMYSRSAQDRISRRRLARGDKRIAELVGASVARAITQLDVGPSNVDTGHVFYGSMVEFIMSTEEELFKNPELRSLNHSTAQFVITQTHDTSVAGATPKDMATGNFALLSLWKVNSETGVDLDVAMAEVQRNTIPKRTGITRMDAAMSDIYKQNINSLRDLHKLSAASYGKNDTNPVSQYIFAIATLTNNRHSVQTFVDKLHSLSVDAKAIAVSIDIKPMVDMLLDSDGNDVGKFVVVNVELLA